MCVFQNNMRFVKFSATGQNFQLHVFSMERIWTLSRPHGRPRVRSGNLPWTEGQTWISNTAHVSTCGTLALQITDVHCHDLPFLYWEWSHIHTSITLTYGPTMLQVVGTWFHNSAEKSIISHGKGHPACRFHALPLWVVSLNVYFSE